MKRMAGIVYEPGSSVKNKTGNWRNFRPVIIPDKCKKCGICVQFCPEGCMSGTPKDVVKVDYDYCKGCLICLKECPFGAIVKEKEKK